MTLRCNILSPKSSDSLCLNFSDAASSHCAIVNYEDSENPPQEEIDILESEVRGFVVVTQTCDIVRTCISRPFIEVVPLVEVDELSVREVQKGRRPQYAYIPGVADLNFVADLDRVMTVEKPVLAEWERQPGCFNDEEVRALGQA